MEALAIAAFLATVNERLVEYFIAPLFERFSLDTFYLMYLAGLCGAVLGWFSTVNLFAAYLPSEIGGRVLTAILVGGGSNLVHELFSNAKKRASSSCC